MTYSNGRAAILVAALTIVAQSAYATQPPDAANSDIYGNTAYGTLALLNVVGSGTSTGDNNSAFGDWALYWNTTGFGNTAIGWYALNSNTTGDSNTATGGAALFSNTNGTGNTATGNSALYANSSGAGNTATGTDALFSNTTGYENVAVGLTALAANSTGANNTAVGAVALALNTASFNSAVGSSALAANTTGANNTAFGYLALFSNTVGKGNAAQGVNALYSNTTGIRNLGIGSNALYGNVTGSYNVALGFDAGYNQTTGNDNIYFSNLGVAGESQTLRLGTQGTAGVLGSGVLTAYIAGVASSHVTGSAVYVTSTGQLGVLASSERYKTDVETIRGASDKLARLRPVTFKLKTDPKGPVQYGLIAEEVQKIYPELVIHGADGRIEGVRYDELAPMLLSEVQQQAAQIRALNAQVDELNDLKQEMRAALRRLQSTNQLVARR
jgi:hypothetical protein